MDQAVTLCDESVADSVGIDDQEIPLLLVVAVPVFFGNEAPMRHCRSWGHRSGK
jgi:hypothetical protein